MAAAALLALATVAAAALVAGAQRPSARWELRPALGLERTEVAAARVGSAAYVIGGYVPPDGASTRVVERVDLRSGAVRRVAPLPVGLNHAGAASDGRFAYVVGGHRDLAQREPSALTLRYDPRRNRWTRLADLPSPRGALALAVAGRTLYAIGGAVAGQATARVDALDLRTGRWRRAPSLRTAREHLGAAAAGGRVLAVAGRTAQAGNFASVEVLEPGARAWRAGPSLRTPRGGNGAASVDGSVVAVGGEAAATIAPVEVLRPGTRRWAALAPMRTPRHGLGVVDDGRGRIVALSGGPRPGLFYSRVVERLRVGGG